jgi:anti-sigma factor RsiW
MNISRDVVKDLIPVYLAGDASADTQTIVESYLKTDPELAGDVAAARGTRLELPATRPPTAEKQTLDATRELLKSRTSTLVVAAIFTVLPLTFAFSGTTITFFVIRDAPVIGIAWWVTATIMWIWHASIRRRLRVSGL